MILISSKKQVFFVPRLLGTVLYEGTSWATKYHWDVHWYTSGKHHGLIIANFTQDSNSGHIVNQIGPFFYLQQKEKKHTFYTLFAGRNWYFGMVRTLQIYLGTGTQGMQFTVFSQLYFQLISDQQNEQE